MMMTAKERVGEVAGLGRRRRAATGSNPVATPTLRKVPASSCSGFVDAVYIGNRALLGYVPVCNWLGVLCRWICRAIACHSVLLFLPSNTSSTFLSLSLSLSHTL